MPSIGRIVSNSSKKWAVTWMILRHWPTYPTPLSLTCFFISENSWTKIGIRRFLCSRFRPTNLWNVFLSVRVQSFIKLMGECQKSSHWALNISLQSVQLLTTELLGKKKNPFRFLAGLQLVQTVNIPGRTEWHHGWNWHPQRIHKRYNPPKIQSHSQR